MDSKFVGGIILFFLRTLAWIVYFLPWRVSRFLGDALGWTLERAKLKRKIVDQNLKFAFPTEAQSRERVFHQAYRHLGNLVFEILMVLGPLKKLVQKRGVLVGAENWQNAIDRGNGVIFLSSHVGNWEIMASIGSVLGGMDLMLVTKHLKPEWLHQAIERGRLRCGVKATYEPRTMRDVIAQLKARKTVGFVLDQYAGAPVGVRVPVFGVPVGTMTAAAMLAKRTGAAVVPVVNYRTPDGRYIAEISPAIHWLSDEDPTAEIAKNTANFAKILERDIFNHPDQWLWIHRRFKGDLSPLRPDEWKEGRARR